MNEAAKQASLIVESVARALANWTVARQAELAPDLEKRYGATWRDDWVGHVESQLRFLAQSIAVRRPKLFADSAQWTKSAFQARGAADGDLLTSMRCLREVVEAELPESVAGTAAEYVAQAIEGIQADLPDEVAPISSDNPHQRVLLQYLEAVLDGRREGAEKVILGAADAGLSIRDVYEHVLQPAQIELGRMWHAGEIGVADEHFGSSVTQSIMSILRRRFPKQPRKGRLVVATAVAGDPHEIGVRMVADFFEMDGWDSIYLGANMPSADIVDVVRDRKASLLTASASTLLHLRAVGELIEQVRAEGSCAKTKIIVGGLPFLSAPDLWTELGADGSAPSAAAAVELGNSLVTGMEGA